MPSDSEDRMLSREQFEEWIYDAEQEIYIHDEALRAELESTHAECLVWIRLWGLALSERREAREERDRLGSERAKAQAQLMVVWGERNEARAERDRLRGQLALAREGLARIVTPTFVGAGSGVRHPTRHECRMTARETLDAIEAHDG